MTKRYTSFINQLLGLNQTINGKKKERKDE